MDRMRLFGFALVTALLAGCSSGGEDSPTTPDPGISQQVADDIALQAASNVVEARGGWLAEVGATATMSGASGSPSPLRWQMDVLDVPTPVPSETTFTRGSVTITVRRRFFDESGAEQPTYGPNVDRMLATCYARGTYDGEYYDAQIGRSSLLDVRNLLAGKDTLRFNGTAADTAQSQFMSMDGTHTGYLYWQSAGALTDVMLLKNRDVNPYPLSGRAAWNYSLDVLRSSDRGDVERHINGSVTVDFDGTAQPEVIVNGTFHYRLNLDTGALARI